MRVQGRHEVGRKHNRPHKRHAERAFKGVLPEGAPPTDYTFIIDGGALWTENATKARELLQSGHRVEGVPRLGDTRAIPLQMEEMPPSSFGFAFAIEDQPPDN
jgi:hypothetical protein